MTTELLIDRVCRQCHATIAAAAKVAACPACGGGLKAELEPNTESVAPAEIDHRGIVLPRRHAVGGVISPR